MSTWTEARLQAGDNALDALHDALRRDNPGMRPRRRVRRPKPIESNPAEIKSTTEILGSMSVAGEVHAAYPSALNALCGLRRRAAEVDPSGPSPTCVECTTTAACCAAIDNSAPEHWAL